jgi:hypothetical protein
MAVRESLAGFRVIRTEKGRLRVDIPAASIEAEDPDSLLAAIANRLEAITAELDAVREALEEAGLGEIEKASPRRADLEKYAARHPAPPEWHDEPAWDDEPE